MQVSEIGEFELIERLARIIPQKGSGVMKALGDDCAVLQIPGDLTLWTMDSTIEGIHYLPHLATPEEIGRKALLSNLSDIAAMGGTPRYAIISLSLPAETRVEWVERLYSGIADLAFETGVSIVGGNTSRSPQGVRLEISVLGTVREAEILRRDGAMPGDIVLVTGSLGDGYCGLETALHPDIPLDTETREILLNRYRNPALYLEEARIIAKSGSASSMMDISDGLSSDLLHICHASKVGVEVDSRTLPISDEVTRFSKGSGVEAWKYPLAGGDDYGLLLTAPEKTCEELARKVFCATGTMLTAIGRILEPEQGRTFILPDGSRRELTASAWQHF